MHLTPKVKLAMFGASAAPLCIQHALLLSGLPLLNLPPCSVIMALQQRSYSSSVAVSRPSAQHIHAHALRGPSGVLQQLQSRSGRARACPGLQHATAAPWQQSRVLIQQQQQPTWVCRSSLASQATPEPIPDGEGEGQHSLGVVPAADFSPPLHHPSTSRPLDVDVRLELNPDEASKEVLYDEASKTVRIPLAALNDGQRRTKMVMFTCNKCGEC